MALLLFVAESLLLSGLPLSLCHRRHHGAFTRTPLRAVAVIFSQSFPFYLVATSLWTLHVQHRRPEKYDLHLELALYSEGNPNVKLSIFTAAIVGDRLFFASGNYTFDDGLPRHNTSSLYWIYLNETLDISKPIDMTLLGSTELPSDSLMGGASNDLGGAAGTFFYDHTTLYPYAAIVGSETGSGNSLWSFNTSNDSWKQVQVGGPNLFRFIDNIEGVHASDPRTGRSFYTGGYRISYNNTDNGIVKFQSSQSGSLELSFQTPVTGSMCSSSIFSCC